MTEAEALDNDGFEPVYNVKGWNVEGPDGRMYLYCRNMVTGEEFVFGPSEPIA